MVSTVKGWRGEVKIMVDTNTNTSWFDAAPDPYLDRNPLSTTTPTENIYAIGTKTAIDILEGEQEITGTVERSFMKNESFNTFILSAEVSNASYTLADVAGVTLANMVDCRMRILPNTSEDRQGYVVTGAKFHDWGLDLAAGDRTVEHADWTATGIRLITDADFA